MQLLRITGIALPQLLALLVAGGYFDLLGGWMRQTERSKKQE